jgi:uncharacterized protein
MGGGGTPPLSYLTISSIEPFVRFNKYPRRRHQRQQQDRLAALRNIKSALSNALKEDGAAATLSDEQAQTILRKLEKQRQESITMFTQGGRDDMVQAEKAELAIITSYLPQLADEAQTRAWVEEAIKATGAASPKDMGKVMGAMNSKHKGEVDNKLVSQIATELLKQMAG